MITKLSIKMDYQLSTKWRARSITSSSWRSLQWAWQIFWLLASKQSHFKAQSTSASSWFKDWRHFIKVDICTKTWTAKILWLVDHPAQVNIGMLKRNIMPVLLILMLCFWLTLARYTKLKARIPLTIRAIKAILKSKNPRRLTFWTWS